MSYRNIQDQYAAQKRWYEKHKAVHIANVGKNKKTRLAARRSIIDALKIAAGCADCGRKDFPAYAYDFAHTEQDKSGNISTMLAQHVPIEQVELEIAKCEVVCAVCHRIRTHTRLRNRS